MTSSQIFTAFIIVIFVFSTSNLWQGYRQKQNSKRALASIAVGLAALAVSTPFLLPADLTTAQRLAGIVVLLLWVGSSLYALVSTRSWSLK